MPNVEHLSRPWTFLSNYGHVLLCLADDPSIRMRDVAIRVGITERAAIRVIKHLEEAAIVTRIREGRRNRYEIRSDEPLRHPLESHCTVGSLIKLVVPIPVKDRVPEKTSTSGKWRRHRGGS